VLVLRQRWTTVSRPKGLTGTANQVCEANLINSLIVTTVKRNLSVTVSIRNLHDFLASRTEVLILRARFISTKRTWLSKGCPPGSVHHNDIVPSRKCLTQNEDTHSQNIQNERGFKASSFGVRTKIKFSHELGTRLLNTFFQGRRKYRTEGFPMGLQVSVNFMTTITLVEAKARHVE
jgi:hypothetical protein